MDKQDYINLMSKGMGIIINSLITFFLTKYIVNTIGAVAYGYIGLANEFLNYIRIFSIAVNSMAARFVMIEYEKNNIFEVKGYYTSLFGINVILSFIIVIVGFCFIVNVESIINISYQEPQDIKILWIFMLGNFVLSLLGVVYQIVFFLKRRFEIEALRSVIASIIQGGILLICYSFFPTYIWYVGVAMLFAGVYTFIFNVRYTKQKMLSFEISKNYFDWVFIINLVKSGFWNSVTHLSTLFLLGFDLLIANVFVNDMAMSLLAISKTIPKVILGMFGSMAAIFTPNLIICAVNKDMDAICKQLVTGIRLLGMLSSLPLVWLFVMGKDLYRLWVPTLDCSLIYNITVISCIPYVLLLSFEPIWNVFSALNKLKVTSCYLLGESICSIVTLCIGLHFIDDNYKLYLIAGVSSVYVIIRTLVFLPNYAGRCINRRTLFLYKTLCKNVFATGISTVLCVIIRDYIDVNSWIDFIFISIIMIVFTFMVDFIIALSNDERMLLIRKAVKKND